VVTDFEAHALWMEPCVDLYCVAAEETKARLVARGAAPDNVVVTGIPIAGKFTGRRETGAARRSLGLEPGVSTLLVLSGGFGMGPVGKILDRLDDVDQTIQEVVVCGRNRALQQKLAARNYRHPTRVLGFVTNMHELMAAADLILTKPGGLTSSEALACGKPLLIIDPIPGQETANADFLLERGAAVKINSVDDLPFRISRLLGSKKLRAMARAAQALGRPEAATVICQEVVRRWERRRERRQE
jgi:processive 1,2-diacylglycerol beta-glucosyltransferase